MSALSSVVPGLWRIDLGLANAYLLESADGPVLIDTGTPGSEAAVLDALAARRHAPEAVCHIIVTHHHPDHAGALAALLDATGAEAYMHPADAAEVRVGNGFRPYRPASGVLNWMLERVFIRPIPRRYAPAEVDHEVADGDVLPGGLRVVHAPGHSAGQIALLWPQGRVLIAADACSNLPVLTYSVIYEDLDVGRETLRRLGGLDFDTAAFGHGKPLEGGAAERFRKEFGT